MGIKNRDIASALAVHADGLTGRDFIKWLANLSMEEIGRYDFNRFDRTNVITVATKVTTRRYEEIPTSFSFPVRGIPFEPIRIVTSRTVNQQDRLRYERESTNPYDPYAVKIFAGNLELGYVPREFSRLISVEIDINNSVYQIEVIRTTDQGTYSAIEVKMDKQ
jgi:helicase